VLGKKKKYQPSEFGCVVYATALMVARPGKAKREINMMFRLPESLSKEVTHLDGDGAIVFENPSSSLGPATVQFISTLRQI
jgi:hypothetical protein